MKSFTLHTWILTKFIKPVYAHCDTVDGPVAQAAQKALQDNNVNYALPWVRPEDEHLIIEAFDKTTSQLAVADEAKQHELELHFLETLVRIHREGEGAAYTGLKPAGTVEPGIALADKAVADGDITDVLQQIESDEAKEHISQMFGELVEKSKYDVNDVAAGRSYVHTYAHFVHTVEHALHGSHTHDHTGH